MHLFLHLFDRLFDARLSLLTAEIRFLKEQIHILREHIPQNHLVFTPRQKERLLRFDKILGCKAKDLLTIIHKTTWYRWKRKRHQPLRPQLKLGRPPTITEETKTLIVKIVKDNFLMGYTKIMAELRKLHVTLGATSIRNILKERGVVSFPMRSADRWDKKLKRTFHTLWACDFFTKTIWTPMGLRFYYVLFFINIKTRQVHLVGVSRKPDHQWIMKHLQKFGSNFNPQGERAVLIRDRDNKFPPDFDDFLENQGVTVMKTPFRSPNLNPYAESWVATVKRECLNHFFVFGKVHLEYLLEEFVKYYNTYRPHSSMDDQPLSKYESDNEGEIFVKPILGGLHHHYYRKKVKK